MKKTKTQIDELILDRLLKGDATIAEIAKDAGLAKSTVLWWVTHNKHSAHVVSYVRRGQILTRLYTLGRGVNAQK